jgi:hypothetical protein
MVINSIDDIRRTPDAVLMVSDQTPHWRGNAISAGDLDDPDLSGDDSDLDLQVGNMNSMGHGSSTHEERDAAIRAFADSVVSLKEAVLQRDIDLALSFKPWASSTSRRSTRVRKLYDLIERKCRILIGSINPSYNPDAQRRSSFRYLGHKYNQWRKDTDLYTLDKIYGSVAALAAESIAKKNVAALTAATMDASPAAIAAHVRIS